MATKTIETRAVISAEDRTGKAFSSVLQHLAQMESAARKAKMNIGEMNADRFLAGGSGRISRLNNERAVTRQLHADQHRARVQEREHLRQVEMAHGRIETRQAAVAAMGLTAAHETAHFMHRSLEVYREFDKERRFGKAVMGISDEAQGPLVRQAIHMGGATKYNDIQVLEAQRELAARGLKSEQVLGMMPAAADLGQSLDLSLPAAVKQMEGAMFGFKKSIGTTAEAMASARQTADVQVKAAKISGMTSEDITQAYKYGATPARMAGVSEQTLLAFAGISKKANMGGDEAGVAFRALIAATESPTHHAKEAMLANGLDYANFQKAPEHLDTKVFANSVARAYGVELSEASKAALNKVFSDPAALADPSKFTPGVVGALKGTLGKQDAKSLKSIAGMAGRFRDDSMGAVDANAFIEALMTKLPGNLRLANSIFGAKQGARIANALGDPETMNHLKEQLTGHSEGYASKIAGERMSGFDGSVSRLEGAIKNLESALPRALDNNGKGGVLTGATNVAGQLVQALAEAPPQLQRLGVEAGVVAGIFAGMKGAEALMGGFGLKGAAMELTAAAHQLMAAGGEQELASLPGIGGKSTKSLSRLGRVGKSLPLIGTAILAAGEAYSAVKEKEIATPAAIADPAAAAKRQLERRPMKKGDHILGAGGPPTLSPATPQKVDVAITPVPPAPVAVKVEASSSLLSIIDGLKSLAVKLQAKAGSDTGPGGMGETSTGQLAGP